MYILSTYDTQKIYTYYCQCIKVYSSMKVSRLWLSLSRHVDANKVSLMADFEASICLRSGQHLGCNYRFY